MRNRKPGKICDHLWLLGTPEACVYLIEGRQSSALINAGMAYILPDVVRQIDQFGIEKRKIKHLIILHSHFDHVGIVPYLKRKHPEIEIYASARAWEALANPRALSLIDKFTRKVATRVGKGMKANWDAHDWKWSGDISGRITQEGDFIDLGDRRIEIIETPGHSACSISAYDPEVKALFPSDAAAIPYADEYVIAAGSSMGKYLESLVKLDRFDTRLICADHYGAVTGDEARHYIQNSQSAAGDMKKLLTETLNAEGSIEKAARVLVDRHYRLRPDYFVDPDILMITYTRMLGGLACP
jgi:glyoxylase-like metal-dependent hydrolase (beta-lactamase superfamily II)